jgi:hypothetical protein
MNKQTDLLPWIIGGVSIFAVAAAVALVSARTKVQSLPPTLAAAQTASAPRQALPATEPVAPVALSAVAVAPSTAPVGLSTASPPPAVAPDSTPSSAQPTAAQPPVEGGQIWECMTNGVKTFSNNPCGDKSSLVAVRAINTMNATPPVRYARAYPAQPAYSPEPAYSQQYASQNSPDEDSDSDQDTGYGAGPTVIGGFAVLPRRINDHPHRPHPHHYPGPPRKN